MAQIETRTMDPQEILPLPFNFSEIEFLASDPLASVVEITATPDVLTFSNEALSVETLRLVVDIQATDPDTILDDSPVLVQCLLQTVAGRRVNGACRIKFKQGAS